MTITLTPEQERVIQAQLASGKFHSVEEVLDRAFAPLMRHATAELAEEQPRAAAIERLRTFGRTQGLSLGGMTIRQLRDEARP